MEAVADHEDEGTAYSSPVSVINIMDHATSLFPGLVTSHQLARSLDVILSKHGFDRDSTLLATSLCCDEVCRDMEDELRAVYGQNFSFGGIAGFPFGGCTAFGALGHHIPTKGNCVIVYGSHVGIDFDGVAGRVNRRGHLGSGACCNTAQASMAYCKAVKEGISIRSPDASDPMDAQQVFVDAALLKHSDRLLNAADPQLELPHAVLDCQEELMMRIVAKCLPRDFPEGTKVALLGGVQVNTPDGTPDYFLPKKFDLLDSNGEKLEGLLKALIEEGHKDPLLIARERRLAAEMAKEGVVEVPMSY